MVPITILQTSHHAVLIIHAEGTDPLSVATQISPAQDSLQLAYRQGEGGLPSRRVNLVTVQALLPQPLTSAEPTVAMMQECVCTVSSENIVLKFTKHSAGDWEALRLQAKCHRESADSAMEIDGEQEEMETRVEKFVTVATTDRLLNKIRSTPLWGSEEEQQQHVGNIQARRVTGANAIRMTAELVPNTIANKDTAHSS